MGDKRLQVSALSGFDIVSRLFVDTIKYTEVTFDSRKNADNLKNHGISLAKAEDFDFDSARYERDDSQDYGEERWNLIGWLDAKLCHLTVVFHETTIRAISLRRAERKERKLYADRY